MLARPVPDSERIPVAVVATDPISRAGITMQLRGNQGVELVDDAQLNAQVIALVIALAIADEVDEETGRVLRALKRRGASRLLLVVTRIDEAGVMAAVEAGVRASCGAAKRRDRTCWRPFGQRPPAMGPSHPISLDECLSR